MKVFDEKLELFDPKSYAELSEIDRKKVFSSLKHKYSFVKIDGTLYHKKMRHRVYIVNELVGEFISQYFGLDTVKSIMYKDIKPSYYWLLSKVFTNNIEHYSYLDSLFPGFINSSTIGLDNLNNLSRIYSFTHRKIYDVSKRDLEKLSLSLRKLIVRDFITNQTDRHGANFMFSFNKSHVKLMPVYDYEHSFKKAEMKKFLGYFDFNLNDEDVIKFIKNDDIFQELLEIAMCLDMRKIIKQLEDEYPILLNILEKHDYTSIIRKKQSEIKRYKLLR